MKVIIGDLRMINQLYGLTLRTLGFIRVTEKKGVVTVDGVSTKALRKDLKRLWETNRIANQMFINVGSSSFSFYSFYAIEVQYMLERMVSEPKSRVHTRAWTRILEELRENTWLRGIESNPPMGLDFSKLSQLTNQPFPDQLEYLHVYDNNKPKYNLNGFMLAADAGVGKTYTNIALSALLGRQINIAVCPRNLVERVWVTEIRRFLKKPQRIWTSLESGLPPDPKELDWIVCHYDALDRLYQWALKHRVSSSFIALDECHNFNTHNSERAKLLQLCSERLNCKDNDWSSGTPIKALGSEAIPFLKAIDPLFTDQVAESFRKIFTKSASAANDIIAHRLGLVKYQVSKKGMLEIKQTDIAVPVQVPKAERYTLEAVGNDMRSFIAEREHYYSLNRHRYVNAYWRGIDAYRMTLRGPNEIALLDRYLEDVRTISEGFDPRVHSAIVQSCNQFERKNIEPKLEPKLRKEFRAAKSVVKYLNLKIRGEALGRVLTKARIGCFKELIECAPIPDLIDEAEKKTLIFSSYVEAVDHTYDLLVKAGYQPARVYGDTNSQIAQIMERYTNDPDCNPLIATYDSLSTGMPVLAANTIILTDEPYRDSDRVQATARITRRGQDADTFVYSLQLDTGNTPNVSTRAKDIMEWSRKQVDEIMGLDPSVNTLTTESYEDLGLTIDPEATPASTQPVARKPWMF